MGIAFCVHTENLRPKIDADRLAPDGSLIEVDLQMSGNSLPCGVRREDVADFLNYYRKGFENSIYSRPNVISLAIDEYGYDLIVQSQGDQVIIDLVQNGRKLDQTSMNLKETMEVVAYLKAMEEFFSA